ncbi:hypothetical protein C8N32_11017 [Rhodovulum imhoffii]|uniref:Secreted protein n=1 Tax=Rhodovulum imhoffii TaxID=365340 RepID=A0A2T5BR62_9RHOB|nr:SIMPL domain-containing protein [Rhodovulum imhoffii]MBK5934390.1 hypothetical protein [Rhodovulum imhoffii]PTN01736.1 hypothetical protein C8N32_11017 [Rhodovulum imhoffii]
MRLVSLFVLFFLISPMAWAENARLTVSASASVETAPDIARVTLGTIHRAGNAADAMAKVSADAEAIIAQLTGAGVDSADVQTGSLTLGPAWDHRETPPRQTGFEAGTTLILSVRDLPRLGALLDTLIDSGANRLDGVQFDIADPAPLLDTARRNAVVKARHKAEVLAEAAGQRLGPLISITETRHALPRPVMMDAARGSSIPIAPGEISLSAEVTLVYALQPDM